MFRKTILLCALLLSACDPYTSPAPNIVSIEPEEVVRGEAATIAITLDAPLPVKVDYGARTATLLSPTLQIGGQEVTITGMEQDGRLLVTLPETLTEGRQDVRLGLGDGNESLRTQALTVLPAPPPMGIATQGDGAGPALPVTTFHIDPIADQVSGVPFTITLRAEGPGAALFEGQVQLSTTKGHLSPNLSKPFQQGLLREQVVLDKQGGNVVLTVRAGSDIIAQSNPFRVAVK